MSTGIIITAIICISIATISIIPMIQDYKLKKEKIKADAMVKAEEIKAKNQLEIEKILYQNNQQSTEKTVSYDEETYRNSRIKDKERL